jgi:hypothetical protein
LLAKIFGVEIEIYFLEFFKSNLQNLQYSIATYNYIIKIQTLFINIVQDVYHLLNSNAAYKNRKTKNKSINK